MFPFFSVSGQQSPFVQALSQRLTWAVLLSALAATAGIAERVAAGINFIVASIAWVPTAILSSIALLILVLTHLNYWNRVTRAEVESRAIARRPISGTLLHIGTLLGFITLFAGGRDLGRMLMGADPSPYLPAAIASQVWLLVILGAISLSLVQSVLLHKGIQSESMHSRYCGHDIATAVLCWVMPIAGLRAGVVDVGGSMSLGLAPICFIAITAHTLVFSFWFPLPLMEGRDAKAGPGTGSSVGDGSTAALEHEGSSGGA